MQIEIATPTHPPKQKKAPVCMLEKVMEKRGDGELEIGHEEMEMKTFPPPSFLHEAENCSFLATSCVANRRYSYSYALAQGCVLYTCITVPTN